MTAIIGAGFYRQAPPAASVSISDQSISASAIGDASVSYTISADGKVRDGRGNVLESWLLSGLASSNEVSVSASGSSLTSGTTESWLSCSSDRTWTLEAISGDDTTLSCILTVSIRNASTLVVQDMATVTLFAESRSVR